MADTGIDPANSRRRADAGWPVVAHWICGTQRGAYRNIMDADLDRTGGVRKSIDADRSLRRSRERSVLDRVCDHGVVTRAGPIPVWVAHSLSAVAGVSRKRSCASNKAAPVLPYIESEFQDKPESEQLSQKRRVHLHGDVAVNFERIHNRYLQTTGGVVCATKQH
jgi:hypothetical protein